TIALSILVTALNNVRPVVERRQWAIAFGFGLIHGFGFVSVLADLGLEKGNLAAALVGFNVGVEIGQLAIVVLLLPLLYRGRETEGYKRWVLCYGSCAAAAVALLWLIERLADIKILPI